MTPESSHRVSIWLLCGCFMIFLMVVIGGITRLTGSGLSITEWNLVMGSIPPLNDSEWNTAFEKYKQIPQFKKVNSEFVLSDFKAIFWWEYLHRLLGRLIGVVFLIPFLFFLATHQLDRKMILKCIFLFALGGLQGFLGWFMVKSGLTERTSVSHIRLAVHLVAAFITFGFTLWYALELIFQDNSTNKTKHKLLSFVRLIFVFVLLQIVYGAFVAGTHAGLIYNTYPLMDGQLIPTGIGSMPSILENLISNPVALQFIHRLLAIAILFLAAWLFWKKRNYKLNSSQTKALNLLFAAVSFQFLLGIFTLLSHVQLLLASLHQVGAFMLFTATIYLLFQLRGNNS